ncbi:hypothetical protein N8J89_16615 [Crossiella sp. CA-258035]|uniref:hypothetical protein n=1 Tax=Crossiella sp. CA-258035 TaxID=2981138 RepID=UPI0024BD19F2|nr:hypothetical protein [Crossiella sp. CA-258035]WHT22621.1 hypothetical protein N8J89_16615 [Crossiella sp. CA-258035]
MSWLLPVLVWPLWFFVLGPGTGIMQFRTVRLERVTRAQLFGGQVTEDQHQTLLFTPPRRTGMSPALQFELSSEEWEETSASSSTGGFGHATTVAYVTRRVWLFQVPPQYVPMLWRGRNH